MLAHELAHSLLARTRIASGVARDVIYPSWMPGEIARSLGRTLMDEYRADWFAALVLGAVARRGPGGEPFHEWDLDGPFQLEQLKKTLAKAHTQLPDEVQLYRTRATDLMTMWHRVVGWTEYVLTAYVHTRAAADSVEPPIPLMDDPNVASLPFVRLYLGDTLPPLLKALRDGPLFPTAREWADLEVAIASAAETCIREIWRRLGLTFVEPAERGQYRINVGEPLH